MSRDFSNKVVFITGAAHGQGRAVSLAFARAGAAVAGFDIARSLPYPAYPLGSKHELETLREEIGVLIEGELVDPRINLCYVTEVALNPGGKSARVYVAVDSAVKDIAQAEEDTVAGLEAAKGYIRYELKERMGVRHVPELSFLADRSGRFQARIDELMGRHRKRQKAAAPQPEAGLEGQ